MIVANHISKKMGSRTVLEDVSFVIHKGEIVTIVGLNAAGKSLLLKIIAGVVEPDEGYIRVEKKAPRELIKHKSNIVGFTNHVISNGLDMTSSVKKSLEIIRKIYHVPAEYYQDVMNYSYERLNLVSFIEKKYDQLSLGERSKVEFLYILLIRPKVWLMDEPTSGMDSYSRTQTYSIIKYFRHYEGLHDFTLLLTTNNLRDVEIVAERIFVLHEKKLIYQGDFSGLQKKYMECGIIQFEVIKGNLFLEDLPFVRYEIEGDMTKLMYNKKQIGVATILKCITENVHIKNILLSDVDTETLVKSIFSGGMYE